MFDERSEFIVLKDDLWFKHQKVAGSCVADILKKTGILIKNKKPNISLKYIEKMALEIMRKYKCTPTFLNYEGFPSAVCISVNKQLVHGVVTDYILKDGDVITLDLGATFKGVIADAARTWIYGTPKDERHLEIMKVCKEALENGQKQVIVGNQLGCIGNAIHNTIKNTGYKSVTTYGGHGIGVKDEPHAHPFVSNRESKNSGIRMQNGLSIAIEPMVVIDSARTKIGKDGFTVYTENIGCHFENSVTLFDGTAHIVTDYDE